MQETKIVVSCGGQQDVVLTGFSSGNTKDMSTLVATLTLPDGQYVPFMMRVTDEGLLIKTDNLAKTHTVQKVMCLLVGA